MNGLVFIIASVNLVLRIKQVRFRDLGLFSVILALICLFWMWFIEDYVGWGFALLAMVCSVLVLGALFFFSFLPWLLFDKIRNKLGFGVFFAFYFAFWQYIFYSMDDLGLSFVQFFFTQSGTFALYPIFFSPFWVNVIMALIVMFMAFGLNCWRSRVIFSLFFVIINLLMFWVYEKEANRCLYELIGRLKENRLFIFAISTDVIASPPDYRIRNEEQTFQKIKEALKVANQIYDSYFLFLLPEGSISKDQASIFDLNNPSYSPCISKIRKALSEIYQKKELNLAILSRSWIFFNPSSVDYINKVVYNSVLSVKLEQVWNGGINDYQIYHKVFLVPFIEFTPGFFMSVAKFLSKWIIVFSYIDYSPGVDKSKNFICNNVSFRPMICFESFKNLYNITSFDQVDFIVVSSNDSWFKGNLMYNLHRKSVRMLSIAKKLPVIFVVNGNPSCLFMFFDFTDVFRGFDLSGRIVIL
ncbi:MAG: hypothetical protein ABDH21_00930 [bacterium]